MTVCAGMVNMFMYCYFGKLATESFENMSDCIYDMNWQELPISLQKYIVIMIMNMQKTLYYHGFEVAILNLNTYLHVSEQKSINLRNVLHRFFVVFSFFFSSVDQNGFQLLYGLQNINNGLI